MRGEGGGGRDDVFSAAPVEAPGKKIAQIMKKTNRWRRTTYQVAKDFGTKIQKNSLDYGEGDRVKHVKFGEGTVVQINDGGRDFEVTVEFDGAGRKKMFASFAKLQKV